MDKEIELLKRFVDIFRMSQKSIDKLEQKEYGEIIGDEEIKCIENLLKAYEKQSKEIEELKREKETNQQMIQLSDEIAQMLKELLEKE